MSLPVILRPEATQDLQDARAWYEQQRPGLGTTFAARAAAALDTIAQFPELFGLVWHDVRAAPIRRHPYVIYYRVLADRVEVIAVLHARRDPSAWQSRA
jgi:plasmid stabilization system protein ParE